MCLHSPGMQYQRLERLGMAFWGIGRCCGGEARYGILTIVIEGEGTALGSSEVRR